MFKEKDITQLKERGIDVKQAERQLNFLRKGSSFVKLKKAATFGQGIKRLNNKMIIEYTSRYDQSADQIQIIKFVPASGAATRMFKALHEIDSLCRMPNFNPKMLQNDAYKNVNECFGRLEEFAFYHDLDKSLKRNGGNLRTAMKDQNYHLVLINLLGDEGLNYRNLPKGLIAFHKYEDGTRTAFEEHLVEGAGYASMNNKQVKIHLTVSPEHKHMFEELFKKIKKKYESRYKVRYEISFSVQKPSTDTISMDDKNEPFRQSNGLLLFRPGGHGTLLENLNDIDADLIFIKNIDNVVPDHSKLNTITYKKALAGLLLKYQEKIFGYLSMLEGTTSIPNELFKEIGTFLRDDLGTSLNLNALSGKDETTKYLQSKLNRPIRVCGMVKNTGEPGGGPFWVNQSDGSISLQIVESTQVNHRNPEQEAMFLSSTHFNPVDLVCGVKDYKGRKFDLMNYRDENACFISKKFKDGRPLKAFELPGLWNGSMADWNTVFVEVPISTFTPVKVLHDLLRPEHQ